MKIVYGPVSSWRLGKSLGVDLICQEGGKICSFDCIYCSLGKITEKTTERRKFVDTHLVEEELKKFIKKVDADVITFSGTGEPTLAQNLGDAINIARKVSRLPIAVLTNSSLMDKEGVRDDLAKADIVVGSLDASNEELFEKINRPSKEILLENLVEEMKKFQEKFKGKFSLEVMFVPENKDFSGEIAKIARAIKPDEVQINTPLRSSPVRPLTPQELKEAQKSFGGVNFRSVYEVKKPEVKMAVRKKKLKMLKRGEAGSLTGRNNT